MVERTNNDGFVGRNNRDPSRTMSFCCRSMYHLIIFLTRMKGDIKVIFTSQQMLCLYAFPRCHESAGLPLCYEDCAAVHHFCFNNWIIIEDQKQKGIYIRSRGHFSLPDCQSLPRIVKGKVTCSEAHLTDIKEELVTCKLSYQQTHIYIYMTLFLKMFHLFEIYIFQMTVSKVMVDITWEN